MGPWILSLDASTPATVVAVGRVGELSPRADVVSIARANQTSERLTDHVHGCLTRAGISPADLTYVACGVGPDLHRHPGHGRAGQGHRAGARGPRGPRVHAGGRRPDSIPVRATAAPAWPCWTRRGEVYAAALPPRAPHDRLRPSSTPAVAPRDVLEQLPNPVTAVGTGVTPYAAQLAEIDAARSTPPKA